MTPIFNPSGAQDEALESEPSPEKLRYQLLRYAEDLNVLLEERDNLEKIRTDLAERNRMMRQSQRALEGLLNISPDIHLATDLDGNIVQSNDAARDLFRAGNLIGLNLYDLLPDDGNAIDQAAAAACQADSTKGVTTELTLHMSPEIRVKLHARVVRVGQRQDEFHLHWFMRDQIVNAAGGLNTNLSVLAFLNTPEAIMLTDTEGRIISVNPAFTRITGYEAEETRGQTPRILKSGMQDSAFYESFWASLKQKGAWQGKVFNRRKGGEIYAQWANISSFKNADGNVGGYLSVFSDITPIQESAKWETFRANHDIVTGLPNRGLFMDLLAWTGTQSRRTGRPYTVMVVSLVNFRDASDTQGENLSDQILQVTASRLKETLRESDTVAWLGNDEFALLLPNLSTREHISSVAHKLNSALSTPMQIDGESIFVGGNLGCAAFPEDGLNDQTLLDLAGKACAIAKQAGGNTHAFYQPEGVAAGPAAPADVLPQTTQADFDLYFQPQFDLSIKPPRLVGVESLLRRRKVPGQEAQSLDALFREHGRRGTLGKLDAWALKEACAQVRAWQVAGLPNLTLSVNISPDLLRTSDFVDRLRQILDETGLPAGSLELEIPAGDALTSVEGDQSRLWLLWSMGVQLAADGIGEDTRRNAGNLLGIKTPPLSRLKIHPNVITQVRHSQESLAVCRSILCIGRAFNLTVTAVGIESQQALDLLASLGCGYGQGHFLQAPMSVDQFSAWAKIH